MPKARSKPISSRSRAVPRQVKVNGNGETNGADKGKGKGKPVFEMVVLGSGGGPLETDCPGYLVKPYAASWEEGILALEGGSGLGALTSLLTHQPFSSMFPSLILPSTHNTPVLQAAYIFSLLTCYLITHAHLDHTLSLILLSGSIPPKPLNKIFKDPVGILTPPRPPVYGTRETLEKLAMAYGGDLWPELGTWAAESVLMDGKRGRKRRKVSDGFGAVDGAGVVFSPLVPSKSHEPLHPFLPFSTLTYPVSHGCTSKGTYASSAMFIRYDSIPINRMNGESVYRDEDDRSNSGREFLFFGDVESEYRKEGEEGEMLEQGRQAGVLNRAIWEVAAKSWVDGRLAGIFIECSYDSARSIHMMFGHMSPPGVYHELKTMASFISSEPKGVLEGLRVWITHIKPSLVPHPSGKEAREIIMQELRDSEVMGGLGVTFIEVKPGERILI